MLSKQTDEYQTRLISKLWLAIGIKSTDLDDDTVGELLTDWKETLGHLSMAEIKRGANYWKEQEGTCSAEQFLGACIPAVKREQMKTPPKNAAEVVAKAKQMALDNDQTFEEAWNSLNLTGARGWGPCPKDR